MPTCRAHKNKPEAGKMGNPKQDARGEIDQLLVQADWHVCDIDQAHITAYRGVAIREFPLSGHGFADYLLYIDGRAAGVIEAKKAGTTLSGVQIQSAKYTVDNKRKDSTARPVPYLRVANVQRGYLDLTEVKFIDAPEADIKELRLQLGDILFNEGEDRDKLGRGWIWEGQVSDCIHQNHVFRARLFVNELSPKLVSWWGNTFGKDYFLREDKQTTNLSSINLTKLSMLPIPLPPVNEQHRLVEEVERRLSLNAEIETQVDANLHRADRLRQPILSQAFSGIQSNSNQ